MKLQAKVFRYLSAFLLSLAFISHGFAGGPSDLELSGYRGTVDTVYKYELVNGDETARWLERFDIQGNLVEQISYHRGNMMSHEVYEYDDSGRPVMLTTDYDDWYQIVQFDEQGVPIESKAFTSEDELLGGTVADTEYTEEFRGYTQFDAEWTPYYQVTGVIDDQGVLQEILEYGPYKTLIARVEHTYDSAGSLIEKRFYSADDVLTASLPYEYDDQGNITRGVSVEYAFLVMDAGGSPYEFPIAATYQYDHQGNLLSATNIDPPTGETLSSSTFTYDENGNILSRIEISVKHNYDENGNIVGRTPESGDDSIVETTYEYDAEGNLIAETKLSSGGGVTVNRYDQYGNQVEYLNYTTHGPQGGYFTRAVSEYLYDEFGNWIEETTRRVRVDGDIGLGENAPPAAIVTEVRRRSEDPLAQLDAPEVTFQKITYHLQ
jgi:YD repeat-containing protein